MLHIQHTIIETLSPNTLRQAKWHSKLRKGAPNSVLLPSKLTQKSIYRDLALDGIPSTIVAKGARADLTVTLDMNQRSYPLCVLELKTDPQSATDAPWPDNEVSGVMTQPLITALSWIPPCLDALCLSFESLSTAVVSSKSTRVTATKHRAILVEIANPVKVD